MRVVNDIAVVVISVVIVLVKGIYTIANMDKELENFNNRGKEDFIKED